MRLEGFSNAVILYGMDDVFNIIPCETVELLESKLAVLFSNQQIFNQASDLLATNPGNATLKTNIAAAVADGNTVIAELKLVPLEPTNLMKNYKGISDEEVRVSNRYYS